MNDDEADPAIEAAERVTQPRGIPWAVGPGRYALHGAREALAPIRELHKSWAEAWATPPMWDEGGTAQNTVKLLLRDLARLIYPESELTDD